MNAQLQTLVENAKAAAAARLVDGSIRITVCVDTSSQAQGVDATLAALRTGVAETQQPVTLGISGTWGFCWMEPTLTVRSADGARTVLYGNVTADRVPELLECVARGDDLPELAIGVVEGESRSGIPMLADHPFMKGQVRRLMADIGRIDPENIDDYLATDGYVGFSKALEMDGEAIVKEMLDSGLGGRAGAGFPTGRKWDFLRTATTHPRYLICNADEGDPGAWVNRVLLEGNPHLIIEGMMIAACAADADAGYIYIRYEYPLAYARMTRAIEQAYEHGLLGEDILGSGRTFDLHVIRGAGSYVCGEETGLINSIDSYRGMPRIKPPFPAQAGLWNKPTNVNNVESYANAPMIMRNGSHWWSSVSDAKEKGTKMFTFSGCINWAGCVEIPFGPSIKQVIEQYGGGLREGSVLKGFQPGGPLSGICGPDQSLTLTLDPYRALGLFLGGGGIVFFDQTACIVDMCRYFLAFCEDESCARCTTCHGGTQRAVEVIRRIQAGGGRDTDLELFAGLSSTLRWSNCFHGQFAMTTIKTSLNAFRAEYIEHIEQKYCRAGVCSGLIDYEIGNQSDANLPEAEEICPTRAISHEGSQYAIDDTLCIRCGACKEVSPGGIAVRDRFRKPVETGIFRVTV
jgi:NADH-quinone oxidoreductase subunit F